MLRKRRLELSLFLWMLVILALLSFSWIFARSIFLAEVLLIALAAFSVLVLPELLVTWSILLGIVLATVVLISGIVYLPDTQVFSLLFTYPVVLWLTNQVYLHLHEREASVRNIGDQAEKQYQALVREIDSGERDSLQALLIHWSHNLQFLQIHPYEYDRMLKRIERTLKRSLEADEFVFYVASGSFLILASNDSWDISEYFQKVIQPRLAEIHFRNRHGVQELQFQTGLLTLTDENLERFRDYSELKRNLERQLETDIIIEY